MDRVVLERRKPGQVLTTYQQKELYKSFLNESKLTNNVKIHLSNRLGLPQISVANFFTRENRKARNESMAAYLKLLQGEKLHFSLLRLNNFDKVMSTGLVFSIAGVPLYV